MNPITASDGQNCRPGSHARPRAVRIATSNSDPRAARVKMSATGEIWATTARVATKETPQKTMASSTPRRGGKRQPPVETGILRATLKEEVFTDERSPRHRPCHPRRAHAHHPRAV